MGGIKKRIEKIWSENARLFMNVVHTSQREVLHPLLAKLINSENHEKILDFGCGDGRILRLLKKNILVDIYDKNKEMLDLANNHMGSRINKCFENIDSIPDNCYDAVLCSMVLICIDNESEFTQVLKSIKRVKKVSGKAYFAITHPCFRDRNFSNFSTSYGNEQPFAYHEEGADFGVTIEDKNSMPILFTDYHWSISFTINKMIEAGLMIERLIETKDDMNHVNANNLYSPYLIFITK